MDKLSVVYGSLEEGTFTLWRQFPASVPRPVLYNKDINAAM